MIYTINNTIHNFTKLLIKETKEDINTIIKAVFYKLIFFFQNINININI
jgi:hypothetical protein